jgi:predicted DNA-binding protein (UPF0251 family)
VVTLAAFPHFGGGVAAGNAARTLLADDAEAVAVEAVEEGLLASALEPGTASMVYSDSRPPFLETQGGSVSRFKGPESGLGGPTARSGDGSGDGLGDSSGDGFGDGVGDASRQAMGATVGPTARQPPRAAKPTRYHSSGRSGGGDSRAEAEVEAAELAAVALALLRDLRGEEMAAARTQKEALHQRINEARKSVAIHALTPQPFSKKRSKRQSWCRLIGLVVKSSHSSWFSTVAFSLSEAHDWLTCWWAHFCLHACLSVCLSVFAV